MKRFLLNRLGPSPRGEAALLALSRMRRAASGYDRALIREALARPGLQKLHVGGGWHVLPGWLNVDLDTVPNVARMDATRPLPLPTSHFDIVYSEHMIEHVSYPDGLAMLSECFRVLKPGGIVRIVTPDLRTVLSLATANDDQHRAYLAWFYGTFCPPGTPPTWDQAINTFFYSWGHRHLYTEEALRANLETAGFRDVCRTTLTESRHEALCDVSNATRHPRGFLEFESLALEATKP